MKIDLHAVLPAPDLRQVYAAAGGDQAEAYQLYSRALELRAEAAAKMEQYPLVYGYEPPKWAVCDALLDLPLKRPHWKQLYGMDFEPWKAAMRAALGFLRRVRVLLILGGNRGGKTEYMCKRLSELMHVCDGAITWALHSTGPMSVEYHHQLFFKFLPPELRGRDIKSRTTYIAFKTKTGFSDDKFVLPNGSLCSFRYYTMDPAQAIEGGEPKAFAADELVPPDWVESLRYRITNKDGWGFVGFTPIKGYSATVKMFLDGARIVKKMPGYLLPKDGGLPDIARALGFESDAEMARAHSMGMWSRPCDCNAWLTGGTGLPSAPDGRRFEEVPVVARCAREDYAVVYFHSADNPFGKPQNIAEAAIAEKAIENRKMRFYGMASKAVSARFAKFSEDVHVVPDAAVPKAGTNYQVCDPARGRNMFQVWVRITKDGKWYFYREWPGSYEIPGVGVPGLWAEPDGKHPDGKKGPAQESFGFGLMAYVKEWARLEGWPAGWEERVKAFQDAADVYDDEEEGRKPGKLARFIAAAADDYDEGPDAGARERIEQRFMDSRAANDGAEENYRIVTLQERYGALGLDFGLTPGDDIGAGEQLINEALDYDETKPLVEFENEPQMFFAESLQNTIFAMATWTGADGQKGACKDPVDLVRYAKLLGLEYIETT
jgi:hypothetical protein